MHLRTEKANGRIYLSIAQSYREHETRKTKSKTIKSLGYLDDLQKQYDDPIAHFKGVVEKMNQEEAERNLQSVIHIDRKTLLEKDAHPRKNLLANLFGDGGLVFANPRSDGFEGHSVVETFLNFISVFKVHMFVSA